MVRYHWSISPRWEARLSLTAMVLYYYCFLVAGPTATRPCHPSCLLVRELKAPPELSIRFSKTFVTSPASFHIGQPHHCDTKEQLSKQKVGPFPPGHDFVGTFLMMVPDIALLLPVACIPLWPVGCPRHGRL